MKNVKNFVLTHRLQISIAILWIAMLVGALIHLHGINYDIHILLISLIDIFDSTFGISIFFTVYVLGSMIGLSAALMSVLAGFLYGMLPGTIIIVISSCMSACVNHYLGRIMFSNNDRRLKTYGIKKRILENTFEATLIGRLTFFPFDLLSFISGALKVEILPFMFATLIGVIPSTIMAVSFGASLDGIQNFRTYRPQPEFILISLLFLFTSLFISWFLKKDTIGRKVLSHSKRFILKKLGNRNFF